MMHIELQELVLVGGAKFAVMKHNSGPMLELIPAHHIRQTTPYNFPLDKQSHLMKNTLENTSTTHIPLILSHN